MMALESQPKDKFRRVMQYSNLRRCVCNTHSHHSGFQLSVESDQVNYLGFGFGFTTV